MLFKWLAFQIDFASPLTFASSLGIRELNRVPHQLLLLLSVLN